MFSNAFAVLNEADDRDADGFQTVGEGRRKRNQLPKQASCIGGGSAPSARSPPVCHDPHTLGHAFGRCTSRTQRAMAALAPQAREIATLRLTAATGLVRLSCALCRSPSSHKCAATALHVGRTLL